LGVINPPQKTQQPL